MGVQKLEKEGRRKAGDRILDTNVSMLIAYSLGASVISL